jgi:hypothetical protein
MRVATSTWHLRHYLASRACDRWPAARHPVDHARTTRQHAGESLKDSTNAPGLAAVAVGVVALVVGLFALATGHVVVGLVAVILAALAGAVGIA